MITMSDTDIDTDNDTDNGTDNEKDTDNDTDTENDTFTETDMELKYFCYISIWRYRRLWITCDTSRRKFQWRYHFVAALPGENYEMQILINLYRHRNSSPNDVLAGLETSV